jgi:hypothetical protein
VPGLDGVATKMIRAGSREHVEEPTTIIGVAGE